MLFSHDKKCKDRPIYRIWQKDSQHISVTSCIFCDFTAMAPTIIFSSETLPEMPRTFPPHTMLTATDSGWSNADIFDLWVKSFIEEIDRRRVANNLSPTSPALLVLDGHASHYSDVSKTLLENAHIETFFLLPHSYTHFHFFPLF